MVDRSNRLGRETSDAVSRDLSDGTAGSNVDYDTGCWSVSDLCRRYGVGRDTFYAWRARRQSGAEDWFCDRSHGRSCPHRTETAIEEAIVALRRRFPHLGPRKLLWMLERRDRETHWPAASTIGDILKRGPGGEGQAPALSA
jgi:transposase-like protein